MAEHSRRMRRVDQLSRRVDQLCRRSGTSENSSSGSNMNIHPRPSSKVQPARLTKRKLNDGQPSRHSLASSDASHIGYACRADSLQALAEEWVDKISLTDDDLQKMINKLKVILTGTSNGHPSKISCRCQDCFKLICQIIESYFKACDNTPAIRDFDLSNRNLSDNPQDDLSWIREAITILTKNGTKSITAKNLFEILQGGKLIAPQEVSNQIAEVGRKMERDMHCSSEGHAQVQPLEQLPPLVDPGGAQTEDGPNSLFPNFPSIPENLLVWPNPVLPNLSFHGTYSSPNNTTGATSLFPNFPSIPENLSVWPNLDLPNLPFHGTYSSSHNTTGATSPDQEQILDDFFRTHPTVEVHIKGLPESLQQTLFERMATLLYHLKFVRARDFDEAARAQVQEAWNELTGAGCELQDLEPAVNQALTAEATRRKREELTATIQACRDQLDTLPLQNPDDPFLPL